MIILFFIVMWLVLSTFMWATLKLKGDPLPFLDVSLVVIVMFAFSYVIGLLF